MNMIHLKVFCEVARLGSLTNTAKRLTYTTSAISQQISVLERETGTILFHRSSRGVRLTAAGQIFLEHAERMLAEHRAAQRSLQAIARSDGGRLRFGSFSDLNVALIPQVFAQFRRDHPGVELTLLEASHDSMLDLLDSGDVDAVAVYGLPGVALARPHQTEFTPLLDDPLHVLLPAGHPLAGRERLPVMEVVGESWIQCTDQSDDIEALNQIAERSGGLPEVAFQFDDLMTLQGMVAAGMGVALSSSLVVPSLRADVRAVRLAEPDLNRTVYVVTHQMSSAAPAVAWLREYLSQAAKDLWTSQAGKSEAIETDRFEDRASLQGLSQSVQAQGDLKFQRAVRFPPILAEHS